MKLKREVIKYVRDRAKSKYKLGEECKICRSQDTLELHHYYSISLLVAKWLDSKKYKPEEVLDWRDEFITEHQTELYIEVVTLCNYHHQHRLHNIYGQTPPLSSASKQKNWINIQRDKNG